MQHIPLTSNEIKHIFTAVNLVNHNRKQYIGDEDGACPYPFEESQGTFNDLFFTPDELPFEEMEKDQSGIVFHRGEDGLIEIPLMPLEGVTAVNGVEQEIEIQHDVEESPVIWIKREALPSEPIDLYLTYTRAYAKKMAALRAQKKEEIKQADALKSQKEDERCEAWAQASMILSAKEDGEIFEPLPGQPKVVGFTSLGKCIDSAMPVPQPEVERRAPPPRRDNVVKLLAAKKQTRRHIRPPRDFMKFAGKILTGEAWKEVALVMYVNIWYGRLCDIKKYHGKSERKGSYFTLGNTELARLTGRAKHTVSDCLMAMKSENLIFLRQLGKKGKGCSIWELPLNMKHVFSWRRRHKKYPTKHA